jgi:hypothetical protein
MGSVRVPASDGPKASMMPDTIRRDSQRLHACSGGKTALICRNVVMLIRAAERDRIDPRVGTDSVMRMSQHKMVTFVNGNVVATWVLAPPRRFEQGGLGGQTSPHHGRNRGWRVRGQQNAVADYSAEQRSI